MAELHVTVYGTPRPAGSKRAFVVNGRAVVSDANKNSRPWKLQVAQHAGEAMDGRPLIDEPVKATFIFHTPRPKGHYKADGELSAKGRRERYPAKKPDLLKLARAVEDALSGVVYRDDALIIDERLIKQWGEPERVEIWIVPVSDMEAA